jgi:hypothetical protein
MPDFESMTLEELEAHKLSLKRKIDEIHEEAREASEVQAEKIEESHREEARRQLQILADKNGRTLQQEAEYWEGRLTPNGDTGRWVQALLVLGRPGKVRLQ